MAIALKFSKEDSGVQWGFRLVGGADFETPLVVIKVYENSLADKLGLEEGDIVVRINDTATAGLTHSQAHELLSKVGNEFELGVRRGDILYYQQWINDIENNVEVSDLLKNMVQEDDQYANKREEEHLREKHTKIEATSTQRTSVREEVHQVQETQQIKEIHLGGDKKWSTFLQRPDNVQPVNKKLEEKRKQEAAPYKVVITKQKRRNPYSKNVTFEDQETVIEEQQLNREEVEELVADLELHETTTDLSELDVEVKITEREEIDIYEEELQEGEEDRVEVKEIEEKILDLETSEISLSLEEQLRQVQSQLQALSQLPSAIQTTLDAVSQQLAQIVGVKKQAEEAQDEEPNEEATEMDDDQVSLPDRTEADLTDRDDENVTLVEDLEEDMPQIELEVELEPEVPAGPTEEELEAERLEEEKQAKKTKEMDMRPIQRPIILPGGRKWTEPDDACPSPRTPKMSDEKIADTIETFSEVIVGKTKGINFLKYTPPPKNLDYLQRSEVYKLVHDMEPPVRGISTRVEKILSEQDYVPHGAP